VEFTEQLAFVNSASPTAMPIYRVLDSDGTFIRAEDEEQQITEVSKNYRF
jgi:hypothetical protein